MTKDSCKQISLQLLLFVDNRPSSQEYMHKLQNYLNGLETDYSCQLDIIYLEDQPYLVEHFKLVVTPALVKISPGNKQTIAGTNLISELQKWWPRWQNDLREEEQAVLKESPYGNPDCSSVGYSAELLKLADEIFMLKKEKEELLKKLQFKDQVLAMLVHDLRSPLTAASLALETLQLAEKTQSPERFAVLKKQLYQKSKYQFKLMERIISDILHTSKSVSGKFEIKSKPLYLQSLCQDILTQLEKRFEDKSQQIISDFPQDLPEVYGDKELLSQVLINLLENASKYTPENGKVTIALLHRTSQKVQVSICDNGPGIPEEKKEMIFQGHFRLKRDENQDGYGIGLALCRQVITAHYGQIWVENSPQGGSCFYFTLPVYK